MEPKQTIPAPVKFKKLTLFILAAASLMASGYWMTHDVVNWLFVSLLIYAVFNGVYLVYRLNDFIDQDVELKLNLKRFFASAFHKLLLSQFVLVLMPLAFYYLNVTPLLILGSGAILGVFYSLTFKNGDRVFRIKNLFLIKNIAIGLVWGSLVIVGAGTVNNTEVLCLFAFATMQVLIGSAVRDVPDVEKDQLAAVKSLPVVMGVGKSITFLHGLNFVSILAALICNWEPFWVIAFSAIGVWRTINLSLLRSNPLKPLWSQGFNLATCFFIFVVVLVYRYYGA